MNRRTKHMKKYVPDGVYCYDHHGRCRFWKIVEHGENWLDDVIRCEYLAQNFRDEWLLNDKCKICDLHDVIYEFDYRHKNCKRSYWKKQERWKAKQKMKNESK